jgi:hypothetical protein
MPLEKIDALAYSQDRFAARHDGKGVCFRLAFLWAATSLVGGSFNYALDKKGIDVDSTIKEFDKYVKPAAALIGRPEPFVGQHGLRELANVDAAEAMTFVNRWGVSFKDRNGTSFGGVKMRRIKEANAATFMAQLPNPNVTFILGYYGYENQKPTGHATAYSNSRFFDPNHGAYFCRAPNPAVMGQDIDAHVATVEVGWTPSLFIVYELAEAAPRR